jgi:hypothetical protein
MPSIGLDKGHHLLWVVVDTAAPDRHDYPLRRFDGLYLCK